MYFIVHFIITVPWDLTGKEPGRAVLLSAPPTLRWAGNDPAAIAY